MRSPQLPPKGDGPLPDLTSGAMWLATATAGLVALALPGADRSHLVWTLALAAFAFAWGGFSLWMGLTRRTMSIGLRAVVTAAMMPVVALALWATGGEDSFLEPVLLFTALFIGYFFDARYAWPLLGLFIATYSCVRTTAWRASAVAPYDTTDPVELFRLADARLLEGKRRSRQGLTAAA